MRHGNKINHLGMKTGHRASMLANMAVSLIMHKRIETTLAKAKELRTFVEPVISKSRNDTTHSRRTVFSILRSKYAVKELFGAVVEKIGQRPGGYTRILHTGFRHGDSAEMAMIELVDYNENYTKQGADKTEHKRTRRRGKKAGGTEITAVLPEIAEADTENAVSAENTDKE